MPIYDYRCTACEAVDRDQYYRVVDKPRRRDCGHCGAPDAQEQDFRAFGKAQIHHDHSSMYGKYHPGFGEVVHSYEHKRQLLKKYDSIEAADPVHGSRSHVPDEYTGDKARDERPSDISGVLFADSEDEIIRQIESAPVNLVEER